MKISDHSRSLAAERERAAQDEAEPPTDGKTRHDVAYIGGPDGDYRYATLFLANGHLAMRKAMSLTADVIFDLTDFKMIKYMPDDKIESKHGISSPPTDADIARMHALPLLQKRADP